MKPERDEVGNADGLAELGTLVQGEALRLDLLASLTAAAIDSRCRIRMTIDVDPLDAPFLPPVDALEPA